MRVRLQHLLLAIAFCQGASARQPELLQLSGDLQGVHDPAVIRERDTYYLFVTNGPRGNLIPIRCSHDLHEWKLCGHVFDQLPDWAIKEIPGARAPWAPDISYRDGKFFLYYAVSTLGKADSAIGLATNRTLDSKSPLYRWVDEGLVLRSHQNQDDWNAIDPNLFDDRNHDLWLTWGSYWSGIKMRRLDRATGKLSTVDSTMYSLASRSRKAPISGSVEAPFLIRHGAFYYLFVSWDQCCKGAASTYRVAVGRTRKVTGPYLDRDGKPMTEGGGSIVIEATKKNEATTKNWFGPGHEAVLQDHKQDYLFFHAYQGTTGRPYLQISTIVWTAGWPKVATLP